MDEIKLNTIPEAIEAIRNGQLIIVVDDEDRENEGDFIAAAEKVTPEMVNFMTKYGRGLVCAPITEERCDELELDMTFEPFRSISPCQVKLKIGVFTVNFCPALIKKTRSNLPGWAPNRVLRCETTKGTQAF